MLDGKVAANVTAAYSTGNPGWRNVSKNPAETRMWLNETLASGMVPYLHFVGAENGLPKTDAGSRSAQIIFSGLRSTMRTSRRGAPSPTLES